VVGGDFVIFYLEARLKIFSLYAKKQQNEPDGWGNKRCPHVFAKTHLKTQAK
jgi:hypothetical protein